jgi:hypothetical protein
LNGSSNDIRIQQNQNAEISAQGAFH